MKESLKRPRKLVEPFRIVNGKGFRPKEEGHAVPLGKTPHSADCAQDHNDGSQN